MPYVGRCAGAAGCNGRGKLLSPVVTSGESEFDCGYAECLCV